MKAEDYFYRIPEDANKNGDCIINTGNGIFRPLPGDEIDEHELNKYLGAELRRARAILLKRLCMKKTFEGWRSVAVHTYHTRETG